MVGSLSLPCWAHLLPWREPPPNSSVSPAAPGWPMKGTASRQPFCTRWQERAPFRGPARPPSLGCRCQRDGPQENTVLQDPAAQAQASECPSDCGSQCFPGAHSGGNASSPWLRTSAQQVLVRLSAALLRGSGGAGIGTQIWQHVPRPLPAFTSAAQQCRGPFPPWPGFHP